MATRSCRLLIVTLLILAGCGSTQKAFDTARALDHVDAYEIFLREHPKDPDYSSLARNRIAELRDQEAFEKADQAGTCGAYSSYIAQADPNSANHSEAGRKLDGVVARETALVVPDTYSGGPVRVSGSVEGGSVRTLFPEAECRTVVMAPNTVCAETWFDLDLASWNEDPFASPLGRSMRASARIAQPDQASLEFSFEEVPPGVYLLLACWDYAEEYTESVSHEVRKYAREQGGKTAEISRQDFQDHSFLSLSAFPSDKLWTIKGSDGAIYRSWLEQESKPVTRIRKGHEKMSKVVELAPGQDATVELRR